MARNHKETLKKGFGEALKTTGTHLITLGFAGFIFKSDETALAFAATALGGVLLSLGIILKEE